MDEIKIAGELVKIAKGIMGMEFDTEEAKKKYEQEHNVRPGTKLEVRHDGGGVESFHGVVSDEDERVYQDVLRSGDKEKAIAFVKSKLGKALVDVKKRQGENSGLFVLSRMLYGNGTEEAKNAVSELDVFCKSGLYDKTTSNKKMKLVKNLGIEVRRSSSNFSTVGDKTISISDVESVFHEAAHSLFVMKGSREAWPSGPEGEWAEVNKLEPFYFSIRAPHAEGGIQKNWNQTERYARLFELYVKRNKKLLEVAPKLYKKIEGMLHDSASVVSAFQGTRNGGPSDAFYNTFVKLAQKIVLSGDSLSGHLDTRKYEALLKGGR